MGNHRVIKHAPVQRGLLVASLLVWGTGCLAGGDAAAGRNAAGSEGALGPPYPIVLAHGFFGTDQYADVIDYWWGVKQHLEANGESEVFVTEVDPFNNSTVRGEQLIEEIEAILEETGHAKVNIVGHSQGGLDARVVSHLRPDLVASVVTLSTPHGGSPVADMALGLLDNPFGEAFVTALADLLGPAVYDRYDENSDVFQSLHQFSEPGIAEFNDTYSDSPEVDYFSIAGRSDLTGSGVQACATEGDAPELVTRWSDDRDPIDPALALFEDALDGNPLGTFPNVHPNDGLVRADDARWGTFLGCVPADHLDEIGQLLGDDPGCNLFTGCNEFDHLELYADLADWLRGQGY
ncbi:MAG: esterase/lipase family protein [Myxococcota bacterium]